MGDARSGRKPTHAAVSEIINSKKDAEVKYSTVRDWYPRDEKRAKADL